ncbi:hypothetical protein THRCLA_08348 [Thraustotheca clavata]|uniref:Uncharacterized protein n=1 Tax=Thraustotheca clavata TaxID=74557 RepID=A0A1V9Z779_9STRA|nr:hypothetical protein THRCLA_08348 [Thraustotheca clavata]
MALTKSKSLEGVGQESGELIKLLQSEILKRKHAVVVNLVSVIKYSYVDSEPCMRRLHDAGLTNTLLNALKSMKKAAQGQFLEKFLNQLADLFEWDFLLSQHRKAFLDEIFSIIKCNYSNCDLLAAEAMTVVMTIFAANTQATLTDILGSLLCFPTLLQIAYNLAKLKSFHFQALVVELVYRFLRMLAKSKTPKYQDQEKNLLEKLPTPLRNAIREIAPKEFRRETRELLNTFNNEVGIIKTIPIRSITVTSTDKFEVLQISTSKRLYVNTQLHAQSAFYLDIGSALFEIEVRVIVNSESVEGVLKLGFENVKGFTLGENSTIILHAKQTISLAEALPNVNDSEWTAIHEVSIHITILQEFFSVVHDTLRVRFGEAIDVASCAPLKAERKMPSDFYNKITSAKILKKSIQPRAAPTGKHSEKNSLDTPVHNEVKIKSEIIEGTKKPPIVKAISKQSNLTRKRKINETNQPLIVKVEAKENLSTRNTENEVHQSENIPKASRNRSLEAGNSEERDILTQYPLKKQKTSNTARNLVSRGDSDAIRNKMKMAQKYKKQKIKVEDSSNVKALEDSVPTKPKQSYESCVEKHSFIHPRNEINASSVTENNNVTRPSKMIKYEIIRAEENALQKISPRQTEFAPTKKDRIEVDSPEKPRPSNVPNFHGHFMGSGLDTILQSLQAYTKSIMNANTVIQSDDASTFNTKLNIVSPPRQIHKKIDDVKYPLTFELSSCDEEADTNNEPIHVIDDSPKCIKPEKAIPNEVSEQSKTLYGSPLKEYPLQAQHRLLVKLSLLCNDILHDQGCYREHQLSMCCQQEFKTHEAQVIQRSKRLQEKVSFGSIKNTAETTIAMHRDNLVQMESLQEAVEDQFMKSEEIDNELQDACLYLKHTAIDNLRSTWNDQTRPTQKKCDAARGNRIRQLQTKLKDVCDKYNTSDLLAMQAMLQLTTGRSTAEAYQVSKANINAPSPTESSRSCKDIIFAVLFLVVAGFTVFCAASYGASYINKTQLEDVEQSTGFKTVLRYGGISGCISIGISLLWILTMMFMGEFIIWASLIFMILASILAAVFMTQRLYNRHERYYWWPAAVFGTLALLILLYAVCIRRRVKFAAVHLYVAGRAIFRLPFTLFVAFVMVGVQLAWAITCFLGFFGLLYHQGILTPNKYCTQEDTISKCRVKVKYGPAFGLMLPMLLIFFWGAMVTKNIVSVTVSGTVASWKVNAAVPMITMVAWLRALTVNFGSICFGSLIVAILETIQTILNAISSLFRHAGNCVAACIVGCLACLIGCIKSWVETFNRFAYAYIGIHGYNFLKAGHSVSKMFAAKGWSAIVNDDLTQKVFFLGNLVVGALSCFLTIQIASSDLEKNSLAFSGLKKPEAVVGVIGFLIGYVVNNLFMSVMGGAVTTIFVLWAEDPAGWQITQPKHYEKLHSAWLKIYPDEYNNGSGKPQA